MFDNRFQFTEIRIPVGGSVTWRGAGRNPHNAVASDESWSTETEFGSLEQLEGRLNAQTKLVSLMLANNEIGVLQPLAEVGTDPALPFPVGLDEVDRVLGRDGRRDQPAVGPLDDVGTEQKAIAIAVLRMDGQEDALERWIEERRGLSWVLAHLNEASFDTELVPPLEVPRG